MRYSFLYIFLSIILISCNSDETPYSYLSRADAVSETVDVKIHVLDDKARFFYLVQANEMYVIWGNGQKDSEYILKNKNLIDEVKPTNTLYPLKGEFDLRIKTLGLKKLDFSKTNDTIIAANMANTISALVLTNCKNIKDLRFTNQPIAFVDLSKCTTLNTLYCGYTEGVQTLTGWDKLTKLETVSINGSMGESVLNLTASDSLKAVSIAHTDAKAINLDGLTALKTIELKDNSLLDAMALNILFTSLPKVVKTGYTISLVGNKGDDECDKSIAIQKGWSFK